jgi:predicted transcriptional regulator
MNKLDKIKSIKKSKPAIYKAIELKITNPAMPLNDIAKIVKRDPSNIYRAFKNYGIDTKRQRTYKQFESEILYGKQELLINGITSEKVDESKLKDIAITYGIIKEKQLLVDGKSTQNISMAHIVEKMDKKFRMENGSNEYIPNSYNKDKGIDSNKWNKKQAAIKDTIIENNASQDASDSV